MVFKRFITAILGKKEQILLSRHTTARAQEIPQMKAEALDLQDLYEDWGDKFKI